jgi:hypothetical protein
MKTACPKGPKGKYQGTKQILRNKNICGTTFE